MADRKPSHQFVLPNGRYRAEQLVDGVLVNPVLPKQFDNTSNETRPQSHQKWWGVPFIVSNSIESLDAFYDGRDDEYADEARRDWHGRGRAQWLDAFPTGFRFTVRCLDAQRVELEELRRVSRAVIARRQVYLELAGPRNTA